MAEVILVADVALGLRRAGCSVSAHIDELSSLLLLVFKHSRWLLNILA